MKALLPILVLAMLALVAWAWMRIGALRAWQRYAQQIGGEFKTRNRFSPASIFGTLHDRPFMLEIAVSNEDDAPYHHTRASLPLRNRAGFILGLRRKSLLEEAQTRREKPPFDLQDPEFERLFFLVSNDGETVPQVLPKEVRRELSRYSDVEIYVRLDRVEWRRAGAQSDFKAIQRLNETLVDLAETIDTLPSRPRSLSQRMTDEALIAKGV